MLTDKAVDNLGNRFWKITTEADEYPVTVSQVKEFARIDADYEDDIIETFIDAVVKNIEMYLGRALVERTYTLIMDEWNVRDLYLPFPPLISVTSISTLDEDNTETTYSSDYYYVITESIPGRIVIKQGYTEPTNTQRDAGGFKIVYKAGYGDSDNVPKIIKTAIMQWVTYVYENRSMTEENDLLNKYNEPPNDVKKMIQQFRVLRV